MSIFTIITFFVPLCLFGVIFVSFFGFIVWVIVQGSKPPTPAEKVRKEREAAQKLDAASPPLVPWQPTAFTDLSFEWKGSYSRFMAFNARGYAPSLQHSGRALFHFVLYKKGSRGFLIARTSTREVHIALTRDSISPRVAGLPLGAMRISSGEIFDTTRRKIGTCSRAKNMQAFFNGLELGRSQRTYSLTMHGQEIAQMQTVRSAGMFSAPEPLVVRMHPSLSREAEDWLLVICMLEIGYYGPIRTAGRNRATMPRSV